MPVIMMQDGRAGTALTHKSGSHFRYDFVDPDEKDNKAAAWYGFARFGLGEFGRKLN